MALCAAAAGRARRRPLRARLAALRRGELRAEPEPDEERLLDGVRDRPIVFGHSHQQFRRPGPDGTELLNPGSAGMPLDGDTRSAWAVRYDDGQFEFRRTEYDNQRAADAYRKLGGSSASSRRAGSSAAPTRPATPPARSRRTERVRDRAALLRLLCGGLEPVLADPLDLAPNCELHRGDAEARVGLVERADRVGLELRGRMALLCEPVGERHREARRMRRSDQLLRARLAAGLARSAMRTSPPGR